MKRLFIKVSLNLYMNILAVLSSGLASKSTIRDIIYVFNRHIERDRDLLLSDFLMAFRILFP